MTKLLALCLLLSACAIETDDPTDVDVEEEALTVQCFSTNVTTNHAGHPPPYSTMSIAGYMAWQGGYQANHCTGIYTPNPSCTNTSGASGLINFIAGNPPHQWASGQPNGRIAEFFYTPNESGDDTDSNVFFSDSLGTRYGQGTIKATHPNAGNVWKVELCVVKCTQSAPGC